MTSALDLPQSWHETFRVACHPIGLSALHCKLGCAAALLAAGFPLPDAAHFAGFVRIGAESLDAVAVAAGIGPVASLPAVLDRRSSSCCFYTSKLAQYEVLVTVRSRISRRFPKTCRLTGGKHSRHDKRQQVQS